MGLAGLLDGAEERREPAGHQVSLAKPDEAIVEHVELHPHLDRDQRPKRARILPGIADSADDRVRVGGINNVEPHYALRSCRRGDSEKALLIRIQLDDRAPVLPAMTVAREGLVDVEDACQVLGPLDIAREPEEAIRKA